MPNPPQKRRPPPAHQREADLRIGKKGVTPETVKEVRRRMKTHRTLKLRILRAALSGETKAETLAQNLADSADAHLVEVRGHTFVITRKSASQR